VPSTRVRIALRHRETLDTGRIPNQCMARTVPLRNRGLIRFRDGQSRGDFPTRCDSADRDSAGDWRSAEVAAWFGSDTRKMPLKPPCFQPRTGRQTVAPGVSRGNGSHPRSQPRRGDRHASRDEFLPPLRGCASRSTLTPGSRRGLRSAAAPRLKTKPRRRGTSAAL